MEVLVEKIIKNEKNGVAKLAYQKYLRDLFYGRYEKAPVKKYRTLSVKELEEIESITREVLDQCEEKLPSISSPITIYVLPWFPTDDDDMFNGVTGVTSWQSTFQILISSENFSEQSLRETVAHEYNHAVFLCHHLPSNKTILDSMVMEGLAEHFREEVVGGEKSPWSKALSEKEVVESLKLIGDDLSTINYQLHSDIFFGSDTYDRWTGYSAGYKIVESFLEKKRDSNWTKLMKMKPKDIFTQSFFDS